MVLWDMNRSGRFSLGPVMSWVGLLTLLGGGALPAAEPVPDFSAEVRPILSNACFKCHGPDDKGRKSGLRLDLAEFATKPAKSGEIAIVPGHPESSELIKRIRSDDADEVMPPASTKQVLTAAQKDILTRWVAAGAEYRPHWAFVAPQRPALPPVRQQDWPRNDLDRFVLAKLEAAGLAPSAPADRFTLLRRVSLDLIGLPPTPAEADAFVADTRPDAYARVVDRLLASPRYGERWARKWLDLARYADTNGYEKDRPRSMWPYRDWVIQALNGDMPFDQFTIRQLAGDLLPGATQDDRIATGFHRNTMINEEGGIDPLEYRFYALTDRIATTGKTWLGLTTGCAQCHTHKYDPITHREYYQLMAFFDQTDEPPSTPVLPADAATRQAAAERQVESLIAGMPAHYPIPADTAWTVLGGLQVAWAGGATALPQDDQSWLLPGPGPDKATITITVPAAALTTLAGDPDRFLLEVLPGTDGADDQPVLSEFQVETVPADAGKKPQKLSLVRAQVAGADAGGDPAPAIDGDARTGWAIPTMAPGAPPRSAVFVLAKPLAADQRHGLTIRLVQEHGGHRTLRHFRLSLGHRRPPTGMLAERQAALDQDFTAWLDRERARSVRWQVLHPTQATTTVPVLTVLDDDSVLASGDQTKSDSYRLGYAGPWPRITALRLEVIPDDRLPGGGPGRVYYEGGTGDFSLNEITVQADGAPVAFATAFHSFAAGHDSAAKAVDGKTDTIWSVRGGEGRYHTAVFVLDRPLEGAQALDLTMLCERYYASGVGRFRWSVTGDPAPRAATALPSDVVARLAAGPDTWTAADRDRFRREFLLSTPDLADDQRKIAEARKAATAFPSTLTMVERTPEHRRTTRIHHRGEYLQPTDEVTPDVLKVLNALPAEAPRNRQGFARWLVSREHPLTARVTANRQWAAFFGRGIVRTVEDFGYQGESPTNQPLLDFLAVEFMDRGWSLKQLHRLIVLSATYQQSSQATPAQLERDPANLLLGRGPRGRLEAEVIRDRMLSAAGLLSDKVGGPSVFPPQPESVTTEGAYGAFAWHVSTGEDRYRRGLYTFSKRTAPYAMFSTFDGPSGEACIAQRETSNSPLQALTMLNDTVVIEAAQALGKAMLAVPGTAPERIQHLFRRCLTRPAEPGELTRLGAFYDAQLARFQAADPATVVQIGGKADRPAEQAAWTALARVLFNLDESITKD